jgi:DNA-binding transcriptional LysR family regulator
MAERLDQPDLVVLARVIDRGSFARAAEELDVPASTLSRRIAALERRLGVRALERTTRQLRPTEVGELLAARGRRVRAELEDAERVVADHRQTPRGVLRLSIPTPASDFLGPVVADLLVRYPELRVEIVASDRPLDVISNGVDAALHVGSIGGAGHTLGVVRLGQIAPVLAASKRYLDRAPPLRHPRDIANPAHAIVAVGRSRKRTWEFVPAKGGATVTVEPPTPRALVTAKALVAQLVAAGAGLGLVPRTSLVALPSLVIVEPGGYRPAAGAFSLVTPSARTAAPKVRAFADAMRAFVATRPDLFG